MPPEYSDQSSDKRHLHGSFDMLSDEPINGGNSIKDYTAKVLSVSDNMPISVNSYSNTKIAEMAGILPEDVTSVAKSMVANGLANIKNNVLTDISPETYEKATEHAKGVTIAPALCIVVLPAQSSLPILNEVQRIADASFLSGNGTDRKDALELRNMVERLADKTASPQDIFGEAPKRLAAVIRTPFTLTGYATVPQSISKDLGLTHQSRASVNAILKGIERGPAIDLINGLEAIQPVVVGLQPQDFKEAMASIPDMEAQINKPNVLPDTRTLLEAHLLATVEDVIIASNQAILKTSESIQQAALKQEMAPARPAPKSKGFDIP